MEFVGVGGVRVAISSSVLGVGLVVGSGVETGST